MEKKLFESLDEGLKEKLRNCQSEAELRQVMADAGMAELDTDALEGVSGGLMRPPIRCPQAVDTQGRECETYVFV